MTTDLRTEILHASLQEWPNRWEYPATAVALAGDGGPHSPADLRRALLADLGDPATPVVTCRRLIAAGEFDAVAQLLADVPLSPADRAELTAERDRNLARRVADVRYRIAALRRRAELAGLVLPFEPGLLEKQARRSYPTAADTLADVEQRTAEAERALRHDLWQAAETDAGLHPGDASGWLRAVRGGLDSGDILRARRLLAEGPGATAVRPRIGDPVSGLDEAGTALATALRALEDRITEHTALDTVRALADWTGATAPTYEVRDLPGGVLVTVRCRWPWQPDWLILPGTGGLTVWVAADGRPPPRTPGPLVWVLPADDGDILPPPPGVARLTGEHLLILALAEHDPASRLRALLTLVCSQLNVADVLNPHGPALTTDQLTELLALLGVPDPADLAAAVRYETGGRPRLVIELLTHVLGSPGGRTAIRPAILQQARDVWWPQAFEVLLEPYRDDHAELLLLVAAAFHADQEDGFTLEDLGKGITAVAADPEAAAHLVSSPDLASAATRLSREGLLRSDGRGGYALPGDGLRNLLALGPDGTGVDRRAEEAAATACRRHLRETAERRAEIGVLVIHLMSHMLSGTMSSIMTELTQIERAEGAELAACLARIRRYADPGRTLDEQFQRAMRPPEPCELHGLLYGLSKDQEWRSDGIIRTNLSCPSDLYVMANKWLLGQAFVNLLDNARLAVLETGADFGTVRVTATADPARCAIEIADSGLGLTHLRRRELETRRPVDSARGRGMGLLLSRQWFESYGGELRILGNDPRLNGARFQVKMPRCDPPL